MPGGERLTAREQNESQAVSEENDHGTPENPHDISASSVARVRSMKIAG
jgi:hypothetical protein